MKKNAENIYVIFKIILSQSSSCQSSNELREEGDWVDDDGIGDQGSRWRSSASWVFNCCWRFLKDVKADLGSGDESRAMIFE